MKFKDLQQPSDLDMMLSQMHNSPQVAYLPNTWDFKSFLGPVMGAISGHMQPHAFKFFKKADGVLFIAL
jgi:hypothetical protein